MLLFVFYSNSLNAEINISKVNNCHAKSLFVGSCDTRDFVGCTGTATCIGDLFYASCSCGSIIKRNYDQENLDAWKFLSDLYNGLQIERWNWLILEAKKYNLNQSCDILITEIKKSIDEKNLTDYKNSTIKLEKLIKKEAPKEFKEIINNKILEWEIDVNEKL